MLRTRTDFITQSAVVLENLIDGLCTAKLKKERYNETCHNRVQPSHCMLLVTGMLLAALPGQAETINLQQAVQMSLAADPRIKEREQVVEAARGMLQEVQGNAGWRVSANVLSGWRPPKAVFSESGGNNTQHATLHAELFRRRLERRFRLDPPRFRADQAALYLRQD
jgi:hypothetical protein